MSDGKVNPFKKKGGSPNSGKRPVTIVLLVILAIFILSGFYKVDQSEEGVVLRLGKFRKIAPPGLGFKLPFGIDTLEKVPVQRTYTVQFGFRSDPGEQTRYTRDQYIRESLMLTGDLNIVNVTWIIQYQIVDPQKYLFNFREVDRVREKTIRDISQSIINQLVGDRRIFNVMSEGRNAIQVQALEQINNILKGYEMGVNVTSVQLQDVLPPSGEVQNAFEDVNKSIQDMNRFINEGKEAYNKEVPRAEGEATRLIKEAEGYSSARVNIAEGDAERFISVHNEYRKDREVMRDRLYYETIEEILQPKEGTSIVDKNLEGFLPVKNLGGPATAGGTQ